MNNWFVIYNVQHMTVREIATHEWKKMQVIKRGNKCESKKRNIAVDVAF